MRMSPSNVVEAVVRAPSLAHGRESHVYRHLGGIANWPSISAVTVTLFWPGQIEATETIRVSPTEIAALFSERGENLACHEEARNNPPGPLTDQAGAVDTRHSFSVEAVGWGAGGGDY